MAATLQVRAIADRFQEALQAEAQERDHRMDVDDFGDGYETRFAWCERRRMHAEVNLVRETNGLPAVTVAEVQRLEQMALGHVDYARKYSWYCAELALGARDIRP